MDLHICTITTIYLIGSGPNAILIIIASYTENGVITGLKRYEKTSNETYGLIDNLSYILNGNQLKKVTNGATTVPAIGSMHFVDNANSNSEYVYDANGNMIQDANKNLTISYNLLNLPTSISTTNGNITYLYTADGVKRRVSHGTHVTDYCGNLIYENGTLDKILTENGYITMNATVPTYHYYLQDHEGNNRVVIDQNEKVEQVNHYYPFGTLFAESRDGMIQKYKYNGKELDTDFGLNLYDYGARWYDPILSLWSTADPLCEKNINISPYVYCSNSPINRIEIDGRADFWLNGKVIWNDGVNDQKIYAIKTTKKDYNGVAGAGLSKKDLKATITFIKGNSGRAEAFQNNGIAYTNSIEIEPSAYNRQAMVDIVSKDNGNGGTSDSNNREYGGSIENGKVVAATPGAVANLKTDATANILLPSGVSTFHDHPSGTVVDAPPVGSYGGTTTTYSFTQSPSPMDINAAGTNTHYVFGRGEGIVYVYTATGIQAVISMKLFVFPNKIE